MLMGNMNEIVLNKMNKVSTYNDKHQLSIIDFKVIKIYGFLKTKSR